MQIVYNKNKIKQLGGKGISWKLPWNKDFELLQNGIL